VGFRYTATGIARNYPVAGFVRNLPSGEVELEVEGAADAVEMYLAALAAQMSTNIRDTRVEDRAVAGHTEFTIRY
jgi:acylphosphatase